MRRACFARTWPGLVELFELLGVQVQLTAHRSTAFVPFQGFGIAFLQVINSVEEADLDVLGRSGQHL
jgi:hypothetical protein